MCNFYSCFLPNLAHVIRPLTDSLATTKWEFTVPGEMLKAVATVKDLYPKPPSWTHLERRTVHPLMLLTVQLTGSFTSITVVVSSPSPFFSQKLNDAEINYSTFYRELLAVTTSSSTPLKGGG